MTTTPLPKPQATTLEYYDDFEMMPVVLEPVEEVDVSPERDENIEEDDIPW